MENSKIHTYLDTAIYGSILLMAAFPVTPNKLKNVAFMALLGLSIIKFFFSEKKTPSTKYFLINASLYLVYLLSLIYTDSFDIAGRKLDTAITMIGFPLIFFVLKPIDSKETENLIPRFIKSYYLFSVLYAVIILLYFYNKDAFRFYPDPWFVRKALGEMPLISQHPIYASMLTSLGLLFSLSFFLQKTKTAVKLLVVLFNLILISILVLLSSKGVIVALFFAIMSYLLFGFKQTKIRALLIAFIAIGFVLSLFYVPSLNHRFKELKEVGKFEIALDKNNSTSIRKGVYFCSAQKIKENWLFGYGIGDVQPALDKCYESIDTNVYKNFEYNSHNQYFGVLLSTGLLGLFALLLLLYSNYTFAFVHKNWVFLALLVFYSISFLTENMLERRSGVVLFSFFLSFFGNSAGRER